MRKLTNITVYPCRMFLYFHFSPKPPYRNSSNVFYIQGQKPVDSPHGVREYFYYVDHQGMLFLDDSLMKNFTSCFKEKKFLKFIFSRIQINNTGRYKEFPFLSLCGKERNYIRCDDYPIVFTHIIRKTVEGKEENHFAYNHAADLLSYKFEPSRVFMLPETGRIYHPAPEKAGSVGLIQSKFAIELSKSFKFDNGESNSPTHLTFGNKLYTLDQNWYHEAIKHK